MNYFKNIFIKLGEIDRRFIFLIISISVIIPLLRPDWFDFPVTPQKYSTEVYNYIENHIEPGDKILFSFAFGPSTKTEIQPMPVALMKHLFSKGAKIYIVSLTPEGIIMSKDAIEQVKQSGLLNIDYGQDYVDLGFKAGNHIVIKGIASDIKEIFTQDINKKSISEIPMMDESVIDVNKDKKINIKDFDLVVDLSAGVPGNAEWVQYACDENKIPLISGCTSIMVVDAIPYLDAGQIKGILSGMPSAAEYEILVYEFIKNKIRSNNLKFLNNDLDIDNDLITKSGSVVSVGKAGSGMDAQSIAHVVIVLFIVLGNIAYFFKRTRVNK